MSFARDSLSTFNQCSLEIIHAVFLSVGSLSSVQRAFCLTTSRVKGSYRLPASGKRLERVEEDL